MKDLLLTLGHNSSAIYVDTDSKDKPIVIGYETERLNRIKSSSEFPQLAINEIAKVLAEDGLSLKDVENVYVSHWFDDFTSIEPGKPTWKHWSNPDIIDQTISPGQSLRDKVVAVSPSFTHHDAHAISALAFATAHAAEQGLLCLGDCLVVVADGFGNQEEVLSLYRSDGKSTTKIHSLVGYEYSLGLLYQYATAYCGMKENQDEYKFLGYESHIHEIDLFKKTDPESLAIQTVYDGLIVDYVDNWWEAFTNQKEWRDEENPPTVKPWKTYVGLSKRLKLTRIDVYSFLEKVVSLVLGSPSPNQQSRILVGYTIQKVIEKIYSRMIGYCRTEQKFDTLILCGGLHYNVKLNNLCLHSLPANVHVCVMPWAGDQGAAVGLMAWKRGVTETAETGIFNSLCIGKRSLKLEDGVCQSHAHDVHYFTDEEDYVDYVAQAIADGKIVNTITGPMEFGPRALCHTSTLALPTKKNVETINDINGRNTVMPFAPVMIRQVASRFFEDNDLERVIGSLKFMIITLDYKEGVDVEKYGGVMHAYPTLESDGPMLYSGRPQLVELSSTVGQVLKKLARIQIARGQDPHEAIINTSFNTHGVPIVFSVQDALTDMEFNRQEAKRLGLPVGQIQLAIGNF